MVGSDLHLGIAHFVSTFFQDVVNYTHYFAAEVCIHLGPHVTALFRWIPMKMVMAKDLQMSA